MARHRARVSGKGVGVLSLVAHPLGVPEARLQTQRAWDWWGKPQGTVVLCKLRLPSNTQFVFLFQGSERISAETIVYKGRQETAWVR